MDDEELGKPPPLDPSMEDGTVTVPMPTTPLVGRVAATAEPPPRPRERAVGAEPPPRLRERAVAAEKPPRPKVWAGAAAASTLTAWIPSSSKLRPAWTSRAHPNRRRGECEVEMDEADWGKVMTLGGGRYGRRRWIWRGKLPHAPKSIACARDPSAPSPLGDEAVQRSCDHRFRLGAREMAVVSRGDGAPVSRLGGRGGGYEKWPSWR
jgi:hypothetical protein